MTSPEIVKARRAGRPTIDDAERLREHIVRIALRLFKQDGFAAVTVEQIALEAATTRRSVSARYPDKGDLLIAAIELHAAEIVQSLFTANVILAADPLDAIRSACHAVFTAVCEKDFVAFYRLVIAEAARSASVGEVMIRYNDRYASELEALVVRAQRVGFFANQKPAVVSTALIGAFLSNPLNRSAFGDPNFTNEASRSDYFDEVWALWSRCERPQVTTSR